MYKVVIYDKTLPIVDIVGAATYAPDIARLVICCDELRSYFSNKEFVIASMETLILHGMYTYERRNNK